MTSYVGDKSRFYVSGAIEGTAGTLASLTKSWNPQSVGVTLIEDQSPDAVVTGYRGPSTRTRERLRAGGSLSAFCQPDLMAWILKMAFGAAPSSALVSPSSTVYEHTYEDIAASVATFSLMKQVAGINTYTEAYGGCAIDSFNIKSGKGKIDVSASIVGLGKLTRGNAEPVVTACAESYLVGNSTQLWKDGTQVTANDLQVDWSLSYDCGIGLIDSAGSTDGAMTRVDFTGDPKVSADITLVTSDRTALDALIAETQYSWEFRCPGPTIDTPNSLTSLVALKIELGRHVGSGLSQIGKKGLYMEKFKIEGLNKLANSGRLMTARVRNLTASY